MEQFDVFKSQYNTLRENIDAIKQNAESVIEKIRNNSFISEGEAAELSAQLNDYSAKFAEFRRTGEELAITIDMQISPMGDAINDYEKRQSRIAERELVLDYFRLTSSVHDVIEDLEASKKVLMSKCREEKVNEQLEPYNLVIRNVLEKPDHLPDEEYDLIEDHIGRAIARAVDRGNLDIDEQADISAYLDDSCELLSLLGDVIVEPGQPKEPEEPETPETPTEPEEPNEPDEPKEPEDLEPIYLWEQFDGYIDEIASELRDTPEIVVNGTDFSDNAILPKCFSKTAENTSDVFEKRLRYIKQYINQNQNGKNGLSLFTLEKNPDFPIVCWMENQTGNYADTKIHCICAGLFCREIANDEVYDLRQLIVMANASSFTIIAATESDGNKIRDVLQLSDNIAEIVSFSPLFGKEESEKPEESIMIKACESVKNSAGTATAITSFIEKQKGREQLKLEILTLFSYFGAVDRDTLPMLHYLEYSGDYKEQLFEDVLKQFVSKGLLSHYKLSEREIGDVYCLSPYGYSSLHKSSVKAYFNRHHQRIGEAKIIGYDTIPLSELLHACENAIRATLLLHFTLKNYGPEVHAGIANSVSSTPDLVTSITLPYDDTKESFIIVSGLDSIKQGENAVIIDLDDETDLNSIVKANSEKVLFLLSKSLYKWEDGWILVAGDSSEDDEPEGKSENDSLEGNPENDNTEGVPKDDYPEGEPEDEEPEVDPGEDVPPICIDPIDPVDSIKSIITVSSQNLLQEMEGMRCPSDAQFVVAVESLLSAQTVEDASRKNYNQLANALMLSKAASYIQENEEAKIQYRKLLAATNIHLDSFEYTGENLSALFSGDSSEDEALKLAAYSQAMFSPAVAYDYTLNGVCDQFIEDYSTIFPSFPKYKQLFVKLNGIRKAVPEGFSERVINLLGDHAERQRHINEIADKAKELLDAPTSNTSNLPGYRETLNECFGKDSNIGLAIRYIYENKISERDFVREVIEDFCNDNGKINQQKIDFVIDETWKKYRKYHGSLFSKARAQIDNAFWARLELMQEWLNTDFESLHLDEKAIKKLRTELVNDIDRELDTLAKIKQTSNPAVIYWTLHSIKAKLELKETMKMTTFFHRILFTGIISMGENGMPTLDKDMASIKYYEPWRNVLRHIHAPIEEIETVKKNIYENDKSVEYDNYRQLRMLGVYLENDSDDFRVDDDDIKQARASADAKEREFKQDLEYAFTYDRISEADKERLSALLDYKEQFYDRQDFACWRNFLHALKQQIDDISSDRKEVLRNRLSGARTKISEDDRSSLLDEAERLLEEKQNFAVAEEYLNRFDAGERDLPAETALLRNEDQTFERFVSADVYNPIHFECRKRMDKGSNFRTFAWTYVSANFPANWTSKYKEDAKDLIVNWPIRKNGTTSENIENLLKAIGFVVQNVDKVKGQTKYDHFKANLQSSPRNKADYQHPIAAFGTKIKSPVNVLVLYGYTVPEDLVNTINNLNLGSNTIVFIDYPLSLQDRRAVAEAFHTKTTGLNSFLLIDHVLAIFLALMTTDERLPALLKCTLPFTRYQPFVADGGATPDDMFCGRKSELQRILDPNGACVVYGGRQLGKTALLQRAESLASKPEDKRFAVYSSIVRKKTEDAVVSQIVEDINKKTKLYLKDNGSIKNLADQLDSRFGEGVINSLLLLIDEADDFLESISIDNYRPLQPFVDLKRKSQNDFKFVLAGLHNVYRTKNATENNGIFGQLGTPLCVKPLSPTDALQLISRPLMYLGFQVDRYPHIETILTNTNYYPGILQYFGYNLVQSLPNQYGEYFKAKNGNPPFTLEEKQLSAIMTSNDLNYSIKEKFRLSLKLDTRYFMLARVIAMLYFENDNPEVSRDGFTASQILKNAQELGIHCLEKCDVKETINLLDEMVEMGILTRLDNTKGYCLRRRSFLNIISTDEDSLLEEIVEENEVAS